MVKKVIKVVALSACVLGLSGMSVDTLAGSTGISMSKTEKSVSTAALGNTTGKYRFVVSCGVTNEHTVDGYLYKGKNSSSCNTQVKRVLLDVGEVYAENYNVDQSKYTVAKSTIYGNLKSNPQTGCIATTVISNK